MDVILLERIERLGQMGDIVKVKPGYARNFLLPQKKALRATGENRTHFESQKAQLEATNLQHRKEAESVGTKLEGFELVLIRQAGENGQLYGSVTSRDIAQSLSESGFTVTRQQIVLNQTIKMLGLIPCRVSLHPEVIVTITLNVARNKDEAKSQKVEAETKKAEAAAEKIEAKNKKAAKESAEKEAAADTEAEPAAEPAEEQTAE